MGEIVEFKRQKKEPTLRDRIVGTTKSGRAFRIGSAISLAGLGGLALKKRGLLNKQGLKETFTKPTEVAKNKTFTRYKIDDTGAEVEIGGHYKQNQRGGIFGTKRDLKMGNIAKVVGITGGAIAVPVGSAYIFGNKSDREKIQNHTSKLVKVGGKVGSGIKSAINTLHKVSR